MPPPCIRLHTRNTPVLTSSPWTTSTDPRVTHSTTRCPNSLATSPRPLRLVSLAPYVHSASCQAPASPTPVSAVLLRLSSLRAQKAACLGPRDRAQAEVLCPPRTRDTHWAPALRDAKTVRVGQRASRWPRRRGLPLPGCRPGPPALFCVPQLTLLPEGRVLEREKGHQQSTPRCNLSPP